jgi:hypothetical protein
MERASQAFVEKTLCKQIIHEQTKTNTKDTNFAAVNHEAL